ncbi:MAG: outer membrane lipoprotein-sorting protein [Bacteroidales bacterium]|nr:outer membrane lipoprotein-sorting protein [Bacteroidales bacterium]
MNLNKTIILIVVVFFAGNLSLVSQDAATILKNMDNLMNAPQDKQATVKITLTDKKGKEKVREAIMKQKGSDKKLYRYTKPESQEGIATLSLPDNVMWLYLPAFGKPQKISLLTKSQAFTGTDFSYEDMDSRTFSERYTPAFLENPDDAYVLELDPKSEKSKYSKIVLKVNKENYYPVRMDYYDRGGKHFKEATYSYKKSGQYWYAEEVTMTNLKKNHSTQIYMTDVKFDQDLADEEFEVENLKQNKEE